MKQLYLFLLYSLFIIYTQPSHADQNSVTIQETTQNIPKLEEQLRNLQQMQHQAQFALEIPGFRYTALLIYLLAYRIVGIQNLIIWQTLQLYQDSISQSSEVYFQVGDYIHGYTNHQLFSFQGFGYGLMFQKINLIWQICILLFLVAIVMKHIIAPWSKNKVLEMQQQDTKKDETIFERKLTQGSQISLIEPRLTAKNIIHLNDQLQNHPQDTQSTIKADKKMTQSKWSLLSRKDTIKDNAETSMVKGMAINSIETTDGTNFKKFNNKIKQTESIVQKDLNSQRKEARKIIAGHYKRYKKIVLYSTIILKQIVFYMLINSLPIICYSMIREIQSSNEDRSSLKMSFSGYMITISNLVMLLYTFKAVLEKGKGSGETKTKFANFTYVNKLFWLVSIAQRIIYSLLIGSGWSYAMCTICSLKLIVMMIAKFVNMWSKQADYYRNLVINFIQLFIFFLLTLDQYYFSTTTKVNFSKQSVTFILLALLTVSFVVSFAFFLLDTGIFALIKNKLRLSPYKVTGKTLLVLQPNALNDNLHNQSRENPKHVKFIEAKPISEQLQDEIIDQAKTKRSRNASSLKNISTLKSIGTLCHSQIKPSLKSSVVNPQNQLSSRLITISSRESSSILKCTNLSSNKSQTFTPTSLKNPKLQTRTHTQISRTIDDALRAQKTQDVIFEELIENQIEESEDSDVVSIEMEDQE